MLQLNCNGLTNKIAEIAKFMDKNNILISSLQETKLTTASKLNKFGNYNVIRQDRGHNAGGGLAFMVNTTVKYRILQPTNNFDDFIELQSIALSTVYSEIIVHNIYIPPVSSCDAGYNASIKHLLNSDNTLIVGDINAHHESWHSNSLPDHRGRAIYEQIENSEFSVTMRSNQHASVVNASTHQTSVLLAHPY